MSAVERKSNASFHHPGYAAFWGRSRGKSRSESSRILLDPTWMWSHLHQWDILHDIHMNIARDTLSSLNQNSKW